MNPKIQKTKSWLNRLAVILAIILIVGIVAESRLPKESSSDESSWLASILAAKPNETCQFSKGSNQITVALNPGEWTCWVVTPVGADYRIDTDVDAEICFADDWCDLPLLGRVLPSTSKHIDYSFKDVGLRHGVFQLLGYQKGIATITIERQ